MNPSPASHLVSTFRQHLSDGAPLDALARELAAQQSAVDMLVADLRALKTLPEPPQQLLPQTRVQYKGVSAARIDAGMALDAGHGFHALEHDEQGQPYRWTGPAPAFQFDMHLDRSAPLRFTISIGASRPGDGSDHLRAFCDGVELPMALQPTNDRLTYSAVLLPRLAQGLTRINFVARETWTPAGGGDSRRLGVLFRELTVMPTSAEDAHAYLAPLGEATRLMLTNPTPPQPGFAEPLAGSPLKVARR